MPPGPGPWPGLGEENIGGGAISTTLRVWPYFFCSSGSEADVWKPSVIGRKY